MDCIQLSQAPRPFAWFGGIASPSPFPKSRKRKLWHLLTAWVGVFVVAHYQSIMVIFSLSRSLLSIRLNSGILQKLSVGNRIDFVHRESLLRDAHFSFFRKLASSPLSIFLKPPPFKKKCINRFISGISPSSLLFLKKSQNYIYFHKCSIADESNDLFLWRSSIFFRIHLIKLLSLYLCILLKTRKKFICFFTTYI